ncbi:MAG: AAA family ATPase [Vulcanimicrobiaceae bacterium]
MDDRPITAMDTLVINKEPLADALSKVRDERDSLQRVVATDAENLKQTRLALDAAAATIWRDVYERQLAATDRKNVSGALALRLYGGLRGLIFLVLIGLAVAEAFASNFVAIGFSIVMYAIFATIDFVVARNQSVASVKSAQKHLGENGKDLRLVAFSHSELSLEHPLVGFDGPTAEGTLQPRSWQIAALRTDEALNESFFEVIDAFGKPVMLSRMSGRTPTHVFADLGNPFVSAYGSYFQKSLEQRLGLVSLHAKTFRGAVLRFTQMEAAQERARELERELEEFESRRRLLDPLLLPPELRESIDMSVQLFRMGRLASTRSLLMYGPRGSGKSRLTEIMARTAGARLMTIGQSDIDSGLERLRRLLDESRSTRTILVADRCDRAALKLLLSEWSGTNDAEDVWLVATADDRDAHDQQTLSRFGLIVEVPLPNETARRAILDSAARRTETQMPIDDAIVAATSGLTPGDLEEIVMLAHELDGNSITEAALLTVIARLRERKARGGDPALDEFGLPPSVFDRVQAVATMFTHVKALAQQGVDVPRGVLLSGPDEADTASIARAIAFQSGLTLIEPERDAIMLANFERARKTAPSILLLTDLDTMAARSDVQIGSTATLKLIGSLIQEMDSIKWHGEAVFVIATATSPDRIEDAVRARFSESIAIPRSA